MRKYEPIWTQIKTLGYCKISAHKAHHARIKKAIRKEKDQDLGYKMENLEKTPPQEAVVTTLCIGAVIHFTLHIRPIINTDSV